MDVHEILRLLRAGESDRTIAQRVRHHRETIGKYRTWAQEQELLTGALPSRTEVQRLLRATLPALVPPQQTSTMAAYREEIAEYRRRGLEVAAIRTRLEEAHQCPVSYSAVWRLVQRLEPPRVAPVVRVEVAPGSEGQVDFGYAGRALDPQTGRVRPAWAFVLVLSCSRHRYAEVVFDQRVATWLACHRHAFEFFAGYVGNRHGLGGARPEANPVRLVGWLVGS